MDILVQTEDGPRAIEIETGKSDAKANVEKSEMAGVPVTLVATEREAFRSIKRQFGEHANLVCVLEEIDWDRLLRHILPGEYKLHDSA